jgi:hypothetical protein
MPAGDREFGIQTVGWAYASSVDVEDTAETKILISKEGYFVEGMLYDHSYSINVKGYGDSVPTDINSFLENNAFSTLSGVFICNSNKSTQTNEDFFTWEYGGTVYPFAT